MRRDRTSNRVGSRFRDEVVDDIVTDLYFLTRVGESQGTRDQAVMRIDGGFEVVDG